MSPGSSGDYLSKISANNDDDEQQQNNDPSEKGTNYDTSETTGDDVPSNKRKSPIMGNDLFRSAFSSVSNEVGKRTSEISSGFASVAERGSSDFQNLANTAKSGVEKVTNSNANSKGTNVDCIDRTTTSRTTGDYLSNLSANNENIDSGKRQSSRMDNVKSEINNAASNVSNGISSGFARGSSDIQSFATTAQSGVRQTVKKGTNDIKRTTLRAQKTIKQTTTGFATTTTGFVDGFATTAGKGLRDINFFDPNFEMVNFTPISANEIAKWIDSQAKSGSEMVGSKAKMLVLNFTKKDKYEFGDVTKELVNRVAKSEINLQDVLLLLKILLALGATVGPLAELLPFTFLIEALNISLEQKVGGKILEVLSKTLDNRLVAALFTSDDKSLIGDVVKRSVLGGVLQFTGKSEYELGDIERAVRRGQEEDSMEDMQLDLDINSEFEEWDKLFVEKIETEEYVGNQAKIMDMKIALALEECEARSQRNNNDVGY